MNILPIKWTFYSRGTESTISVKGESAAMEDESIMLQHAVIIIEKASVSGGVLSTLPPSLPNKLLLTVSFSIIFPSNKEKAKFLEVLKQMG